MVLRCVAILIVALLALASRPLANDQAICGNKSVCGDMATCAEAAYYNTQCGLSDLDRDGDGIPCEKMCGKTLATMRARMAAQPYSPSDVTAQLLPFATSESDFTCGAKRTCNQMTSCSEATFYLNSCAVGSLDRDGDGLPCEGLCR